MKLMRSKEGALMHVYNLNEEAHVRSLGWVETVQPVKATPKVEPKAEPVEEVVEEKRGPGRPPKVK